MIAAELYRSHARQNFPDYHPEWIAQATGDSVDDVWAAYEIYQDALEAEYDALPHQAKRHRWNPADDRLVRGAEDTV